MFPFGEPVVFEAAVSGTEDVHGNPVDSWGQPVTVDGCAFDPGGSTESIEPGRAPVVTSPRIYAPPGTVVGRRDRATVRGVTYLVDGDPALWRNPYTGSEPGIVVELERAHG